MTREQQNQPKQHKLSPRIANAVLLGMLLAGCGQDAESYTPPTSCDEETLQSDLQCEGVIKRALTTSRNHIEDESIELQPACSPPTQGDHYPRWSVWGESTTPIPSGYWIHNLEHGGVALLYRCDEGCDESVAALRKIMENLPVDLSCSSEVGTRSLLTEDPTLPFSPMFATVAWGHSYSASCVVEDDIKAFIAEHYGNGPESLCGQGSYSSDVAARTGDRSDSAVGESMTLP